MIIFICVYIRHLPLHRRRLVPELDYFAKTIHISFLLITLNAYLYTCIHKFLNITCSVSIMLLVSMFSEMIISSTCSIPYVPVVLLVGLWSPNLTLPTFACLCVHPCSDHV